MRILFVVCGEGLGHASRCIHLGHYLQLHDHEVHFAGMARRTISWTSTSAASCTPLPVKSVLKVKGGFFSLKKTLWQSKWIAIDMMKSVLNVRSLLKEHEFDCVVCDTMYGGVLAARLQRVPGCLHHQPEPFLWAAGNDECDMEGR